MSLDTLTSSPYLLPWGSTVKAIVSATNVVNTSPFSEVGGSAIILTKPSQPVNLTDAPTITTDI